MSRKQKRDLLRSLTGAALFAAGLLVTDEIARMALFLAAYLTVGLDVLKEAGTGIIRGQIFDENFLMAIATLRHICMRFQQRRYRLFSPKACSCASISSMDIVWVRA